VNWSLIEHQNSHHYWLDVLSKNIMGHTPLPSADELAFPMPCDQDEIDAWGSRVVPLRAMLDEAPKKGSAQQTERAVTPLDTARHAMESLQGIGLRIAQEADNEASITPHGLQMKWVLQLHVSTGRNQWEVTGLQTSYGKGLTADDAKASCFMEVAERVSSFASFDSLNPRHYGAESRLIQGPYEALKEGPHDVLDPNDLQLEVPYENQSLYWIRGDRMGEGGASPVYVPVQLVFLFCNLDEISLTSGLPSTGLASGNTMAEAKLHALLEVIERDAERIMPYTPERCFLLESGVPAVQDILDRCQAAGVEIVFLDITTELGVPCYKAFIEGPNGEILKGCAANLDGQRAAVSALTEVPFHPSWFSPAPPRHDLQRIKDGTLPNYASGRAEKDLEVLEGLLVKNGYGPIYVDLTRQDLQIPAVKAIIPGLELFAEFDQFSTLSLRQFAHFLGAHR
jgi:ribosomal protein S12 methylthiotransferase accessory factor YcaO